MFNDRLLKQAEKPLFKRYGKQPEPEKGLFDKREKREELRQRMQERKRFLSPPMRYLLIMLLAGCASIKSVKQPFVDIGIDGQPEIIHTLDSASEPVNNVIGAGDALGLQTLTGV